MNNIKNASEKNFLALFREIPIPSYIWQKVQNNLILINYNKATEKIAKEQNKNYLGTKASKMYKDQPVILEELYRCANDQINITREIEYNLKNVQEKKTLFLKSVFIEPDLVLVLIEDITKYKNVEEELEKCSRNIIERMQTEEELRKAKTFSEFIIDSLPGIFYLFDEKGKFLRWNKNFEEVSKYSSEEISKMNILDFFKGKDKKIMDNRIQEVFNEGRSTAEAEFISKSSEIKPYYFTGLRIMIGDTPYLGGMGIDITEQKHTEEELRKAKTFSESIIDSLPGIFYFFDEKGKFLRWNKNFEEVSKYSSEEISKMNILDFFKGKDKKIMDNRIQEVFNEGRSTAEAEFISKSSEKKPYYFTGLRIMIGDTPYLGGMGIDITEQKHTEEALRKSEDKFREAYNRANFYKDLFVHDISNILQNIRLSVELLSLNQKEPRKGEKMEDFIHTIEKQINRGANLILNVRYLTEIEETKISIKSIEVYEVLKKTTEYIINSFQDRKFNIQINSSGKEFYAKANELLREVFENILINAVKYNNSSTVEILIKISKYQEKSINYVRLEFIDNGIGIPDEIKEKLFLRATRIDRSSERMGLGLSLVKKIIEKYNGRIWIENKVQGDYLKGSNFIFIIPEAE